MAKKKKGSGSNPEAAGQDPSGNGEHEQGESGAIIEQTVAEDPLAKFVAARWREIAITLAIVFAVIYVKDAFEETRRAALERSADVLLELQSRLDDLKTVASVPALAAEALSPDKGDTPSEDKEKEAADLRVKIGEYVRALSQDRSPYRELASVYAQLTETNLDGDGVDLKGKPLISEIGAFVAAQGLLKNQETFREGVQSLARLVESADFVGTPALVLLARLREGSVHDGSFKGVDLAALAKGLSQRSPEQSELLRKELPELY